MASSLVWKTSGSALGSRGSLRAIIVLVGLSRPGMNPTWMPSASRGTASGKVFPVRMQSPAARTASWVIRLRVPSSSSSPQRPQLRTRAEISMKLSDSAMVGLLVAGLLGPT